MSPGNFRPCNCKVTPSTYRKKFFERWPTGYPFQGTNLYYCANYDICGNVMSKCPKMHVDHIIPQSANGPQCISNLRPMCANCNQTKSDNYSRKEVKLQSFGADAIRVIHKESVIQKQKLKKNQRKS